MCIQKAVNSDYAIYRNAVAASAKIPDPITLACVVRASRCWAQGVLKYAWMLPDSVNAFTESRCQHELQLALTSLSQRF